MKREPPKTENLVISSQPGLEGRTVINFFFDKKLKRSVEMKITNEFLQNLLSYIENYIDTYLYTGDYEGIRFEDYTDQYKSLNLSLHPCDMDVYNDYYNTNYAEHRGSASFRWIKGPDAKRPSTTAVNSTKKQLVGELYRFIRSVNPELKSELIESLLEADLYDYYDRIL